MARRRSNRFISQAALQALVRFGPELSGLKELQRTAVDTYGSAVRGARGTSQAIRSAVDEARPNVAKIYDRAGLDQARAAHSLVSSDLEKLGPAADYLKGASSVEAGAMSARLSESRAASLTDLDSRRVAATEGEKWAVTNAHGELVKDLTRILQRKQDLARERGAFTSATAQELRQEARQEAQRLAIAQGGWTQSERNSIRSAGIDPDTNKPIPGGKLDPKANPKKDKRLTATGAPAVSADKHLEFQSRVDEIKNYAQKYSNMPRAQIVEKLKRGRSKQTLYALPNGDVVEKGTPGARAVVLEKIPQFKPDLAMTAALDLALSGHLSRPTQRKLQQHFIIRELGFTTYNQWRKKNPNASPQSQKAARDALRGVGGLLKPIGR